MAESLSETISATQAHYKNTPEAAKMTLRSESELKQPFRSEVSIRDHKLVIDEPVGIGGTDAGASPVEVLLAALGACQEITYKAYATALGIDLQRVSVTLEGDIDLAAFFGVRDDARAGFQAIRGEIELDSNASPAQLEQLKAVVDAHCPVLDMLTTPVPVSLTLKDKQ